MEDKVWAFHDVFFIPCFSTLTFVPEQTMFVIVPSMLFHSTMLSTAGVNWYKYVRTHACTYHK